ncbi:MAG: UDP-glucose 6-dehydrogenase [Chloroflexi bacterium]|nr:UDP-glucose 6-dehydrogenase [Chloroflexota bacterium]
MKISVIGMGYAGAVTSACLAELGHDVTGYDIDHHRINSLNSFNPQIFEPRLEKLIEKNCEIKRLKFQHVDDSDLDLGEITIITVGTPSDPNGSPNLEYIWKSVEWATEHLQQNSILLMRSTVQPGTGDLISIRFCEKKNINYISCPEFLKEGEAVSDFFTPDRIIIGGNNSDAIEKVVDLHSGINSPIIKTKIIAAEMIKFASNAFLATKISFINEMANFCEAWGADVDDVKEGLGLDHRIGKSFLNAGVGFGGSCLPKETRAFTSLASNYGIKSNLLESVLEVNEYQSQIPFRIIKDVFADMNNVKVGILGMSFKPNTDDIRESPSIKIAQTLSKLGCQVSCFDPVSNQKSEEKLGSSVKFETSIENLTTNKNIILLMTPWEIILNSDWHQIFKSMIDPKILFDGRNSLDPTIMKNMGFNYIGVGRGISSSHLDHLSW